MTLAALPACVARTHRFHACIDIRDGSGVLDDADIEALLLVPPATRNLEDDTFDLHEHLEAAKKSQAVDVVRLKNPIAAPDDGTYEVE